VLVVPNVEELPIATYRYLDENKTPFVFVARSADEIDADAVAVDGTRGAKEIVRWLIGLGHTRIAYIEGKPYLPDLRLRGYKQALKQAGIEIDSNLILVQNSRAEEAGSEGIKLLLQREIPFTAVFARNDVTAMGVLRGLDEMGVRVPADVSVAGFDNIQSSALIQPPLTTVDHTVREIGRMAVSLLLDRIEGRYGGAPRQVTLRPRLVVRSSCAAPNQKWYADWALGRKEAKSNSR
jgi:DNA-binding LacI/PurR family transcriptional regulator